MCFSIEIEKDLKKLANFVNAKIARDDFIKLQDLIQNFKDTTLKIPSLDGRVFPNYFAPVIRGIEGERVIFPMRYRVRPAGSREEIPNKFNVFNARLDSLETRKTWQGLFGKKHAVVPLKQFYEWVPDENGKAKLIAFRPKDQDYMWVPCLYDQWSSPDNSISFQSFALITTDPPREILEAGHDRCPIFLKEENIDEWLKIRDKKKIYELLKDQQQTTYLNQWA